MRRILTGLAVGLLWIAGAGAAGFETRAASPAPELKVMPAKLVLAAKSLLLVSWVLPAKTSASPGCGGALPPVQLLAALQLAPPAPVQPERMPVPVALVVNAMSCRVQVKPLPT